MEPYCTYVLERYVISNGEPPTLDRQTHAIRGLQRSQSTKRATIHRASCWRGICPRFMFSRCLARRRRYVYLSSALDRWVSSVSSARSSRVSPATPPPVACPPPPPPPRVLEGFLSRVRRRRSFCAPIAAFSSDEEEEEEEDGREFHGARRGEELILVRSAAATAVCVLELASDQSSGARTLMHARTDET